MKAINSITFGFGQVVGNKSLDNHYMHIDINDVEDVIEKDELGIYIFAFRYAWEDLEPDVKMFNMIEITQEEYIAERDR